MGFFDSTSKKSSTSITDIDTTTVGASEGSQAYNISGGEVKFTDQGAIDRAFDFARESLGTASRSLTAAGQQQDDAFAAALGSINESVSGGAKTLSFTVIALVLGAVALFMFMFVRKM